MTVTVCGASDDLIEVEGDVTKEFNVNLGPHDPDVVVASSDGTVLRVRYTDEGMWRITPEARGEYSADLTISHPVPGGQASSDVATLTGNITWVVLGTEFAVTSPDEAARG